MELGGTTLTLSNPVTLLALAGAGLLTKVIVARVT